MDKPTYLQIASPSYADPNWFWRFSVNKQIAEAMRIMPPSATAPIRSDVS